MTSVPCTTTAPPMSGRASSRARMRPMSSTCANVRCDAGTRPQSIGSTSANSPSPGTMASRSSPRSTGTLPAPDDERIEIVPPVKTTAIRATRGC